MGRFPKNRPVNLFVQKYKIEKLFPGSKVTVFLNRLIWKKVFQPKPLSVLYNVKLVYKIGQPPEIFVTDCHLPLHPKAISLPHVFDTKRQKLCLYYGKYKDWTDQKFIAMTIGGWISEWLFHYENWLVTGKWKGGGTHNWDVDSDDSININKEE